MFVAFYDESGNDDQSEVFAMAGILLCYVSSYHFGNQWSRLLKGFGVTAFHATDFHGRRGEFRNWSDAKRAEFENAVVQLFLEWQIKHSGVAIVKDDYKRSFADTGFHRRLVPATSKWKKPYLQAFQHIVADLRTYADHQPHGQYITPIFDRCQEFMGQAQEDFRVRNKDGKLGRMIVGSADEYVQMQAADFLVWEYRVEVERQRQTRSKIPGPVMQALMPHMFMAKVWSFDYLEYLRKRVEACIEGSDPEQVEFVQSSEPNK